MDIKTLEDRIRARARDELHRELLDVFAPLQRYSTAKVHGQGKVGVTVTVGNIDFTIAALADLITAAIEKVFQPAREERAIAEFIQKAQQLEYLPLYTPEHPVATPEGFVPASQLQPGDKVMTPAGEAEVLSVSGIEPRDPPAVPLPPLDLDDLPF